MVVSILRGVISPLRLSNKFFMGGRERMALEAARVLVTKTTTIRLAKVNSVSMNM